MNHWFSRAALIGLVVATKGFAQSSPPLCSETVTILVPQFVRGAVVTELPRVEIRRCASGFIQLVAWKAGTVRPALIRDTARVTISQMVMTGSAFVFVMAGGSYDTVQVLKYVNGQPAIVYDNATKGEVRLTLDQDTVNVSIREAGGKWTSRRFGADIDDLKPD